MTGLAPWEQVAFDSWSLNDAETALRWVLRAMYDADRTLANLRNEEVQAKHTYEAAKRRAFFAPECPKVERGGYTVGDRDAFIEQQTFAERQAYELATVAKEAAQDHLRTLNSQSVVMAALSKNVSQAHNVTGVR